MMNFNDDKYCAECGCELSAATVRDYDENVVFGSGGEFTADGDGPFCDKCYEVNQEWLEKTYFSALNDFE